ncbi:aspartate 1-decarboxylase autocleavage activator PanM [Providencia sp. PROV039]|uniref:aspartate 1-decarboxylase autocleavage activator PanM n=1 Tax=Providencia sp. PROV039 TaxID=2949770 RepID=UPI002349913E|nr:aspartate 1-decarboxylase autocleavage activator PanM [Providencia sp. PROV039]
MRLTIIPLVIPTEQQYLDLHKIWPDQSQHELTEILKTGEQFYAVRFNERLLAAAKVSVDHHHAIIRDFCVREATRRRGVGLYLMQEIFRAHPDVEHWQFNFSHVLPQEKQHMQLFLTACGFNATIQPDVWEKQIGYLHEVK